MNLSGIAAGVSATVASVEWIAGPAAAKRNRWEPHKKIKAIIKRWPARFETARDEAGFVRIIADSVRDQAVKL